MSSFEESFPLKEGEVLINGGKRYLLTTKNFKGFNNQPNPVTLLCKKGLSKWELFLARILYRYLSNAVYCRNDRECQSILNNLGVILKSESSNSELYVSFIELKRAIRYSDLDSFDDLVMEFRNKYMADDIKGKVFPTKPAIIKRSA